MTLLGLFPLGCGDEPAEEVRPAPVATVGPIESDAARARETAELLTWLRAQSVSEAEFWRPRVLYTWTRAEQVAELRAQPVLLTRTHGRNGERSGFDHALDRDRSPLARHLRSPGHQARRFAWPRAWATRMGWPGADYGDRLIRIELRSNAWVARFDPDSAEGARWDVRDAGGEVVTDARVRAEPWRVAAIYHEGRGPGADGTARTFREYVLVSEPAIARVSVGDDATSAMLAADRRELEVLADRLDALEVGSPRFDDWTRRLAPRWDGGDGNDLVALYESALSLGSEHYAPSPQHVRAIAEALAIPAETPLAYAPVDRPPPLRTLRAFAHRVAPRPTPPGMRCDPTMGCYR